MGVDDLQGFFQLQWSVSPRPGKRWKKSKLSLFCFSFCSQKPPGTCRVVVKSLYCDMVTREWHDAEKTFMWTARENNKSDQVLCPLSTVLFDNFFLHFLAKWAGGSPLQWLWPSQALEKMVGLINPTSVPHEKGEELELATHLLCAAWAGETPEYSVLGNQRSHQKTTPFSKR